MRMQIVVALSAPNTEQQSEACEGGPASLMIGVFSVTRIPKGFPGSKRAHFCNGNKACEYEEESGLQNANQPSDHQQRNESD